MTVTTGRTGTRVPGRFCYRLVCGLVVTLDAVITLFPPLYWSIDAPTAALVYVMGGSTLVAASIPALYVLGAQCGRDRRESM